MLDADIDMIHKRWDGYTALNRYFADAVLAIAEDADDDLVWIHDYYLTLLPKVRARSPV
jgi:trehalose-6-phosphate synthase